MSVLGLGTDVVDVDRMRTVLRRTPGFRRRVFTGAEQALAEGRRDPAKPYAARFAAKEAVLKALGLGLGELPLVAIEVVRAESGAPSLVLHGTAQEVARARGVTGWMLSMSHSELVAQATVIAIGGDEGAAVVAEDA
jgi:holo-[acyl-carrier protein] synthase